MFTGIEDFLTAAGEPGELVPPYLLTFAKKVSGGKADDDEDDDEDEDDDDEDDDDDPLADLSDDELREQLRQTQAQLKKANAQSGRRRHQLREAQKQHQAELERRSKSSKKKADGEDDDDIDERIAAARREGETAALTRAKKAEAKTALLAAGALPERVAKAVGLLNLDDLELDDDGLDGIDEAIDELRDEWAELFVARRRRRGSVAGQGDRDGDGGAKPKPKSTSERQAAALLRRAG
jgi:multidrug efflux pump subunit AcrA (membrane-fusion protein)